MFPPQNMQWSVATLQASYKQESWVVFLDLIAWVLFVWSFLVRFLKQMLNFTWIRWDKYTSSHVGSQLWCHLLYNELYTVS